MWHSEWMAELERCPDCGNLTVTPVPVGDVVKESLDGEDAPKPLKQCMTPGCTWAEEPP